MNDSAKPQNPSLLVRILKNLLFVLGVFIVSLLIQRFIVTTFEVNGTSMDPTFLSGDRVMMNRLATPSRFDVVVIDSPDLSFEETKDGQLVKDFFGNPKRRMYIKRIIGMPGDTLAYKNDELMINGQVFDETYLNAARIKAHDRGVYYMPNETLEQMMVNARQMIPSLPEGNTTLVQKNGISVIPENYYFVLGDNRTNSKDSEEYGLVHKDLIHGTVFLKFYPFNRFKLAPFKD